jgi:hypothetical protein
VDGVALLQAYVLWQEHGIHPQKLIAGKGEIAILKD